MVIISYILAFTAFIALIGSFIASSNYSALLTNVATVISIILGVLSIVYSSKSNSSTDKLLRDIRTEFTNVADEARTRLIERNVDDQNFENVDAMLRNRLNNERNK